MEQVINLIKERRSIRDFSKKPLTRDNILKLLEAAIWAPSGKNGQPWKFVILTDNNEQKNQIADLTIYRKWVRKAPCLIIVFLDKNNSYNYVKDVQAIGASIQNMLLTAFDMGIGSCWIGEILRNETKVKALLEISDDYELMAVIAFGYSNLKAAKTSRKEIENAILTWK